MQLHGLGHAQDETYGGRYLIVVHLLNEFDPSAGRQVQMRLKKLGVAIETKVADPAQAVEYAPCVVVSAGSTPRTGDLHLVDAQAGMDEQGYILVNDRMQTNVPGIYAIGDVVGVAETDRTVTQVETLADVVVAFDSDFLTHGPDALRSARQWGATRKAPIDQPCRFRNNACRWFHGFTDCGDRVWRTD